MGSSSEAERRRRRRKHVSHQNTLLFREAQREQTVVYVYVDHEFEFEGYVKRVHADSELLDIMDAGGEEVGTYHYSMVNFIPITDDAGPLERVNKEATPDA